MGKNKLEAPINGRSETASIRPLIIEYCVGHGVDVGCGIVETVTPDSIGVDIRPGIAKHCCDIGKGLPMFPDASLDYVFASHVLEDFREPEKMVAEWCKKLKLYGYLIIVLPHGDHYPKVGHPLANKAHKKDWWEKDLTAIVELVHGMKLIDSYSPNECKNWSFIQVWQRTDY